MLTNEGMGNLMKDPTDKNSELAEMDREKAEVLADYFSSVFTKEPSDAIPTLKNNKVPSKPMMEIVITQDKVRKILEKLKITRSR